MPKFLVVGDIFIRRTFNVEVDADNFDEAETLAIARVRGNGEGVVTMFHTPDEMEIDNISITQKTKSRKKNK